MQVVAIEVFAVLYGLETRYRLSGGRIFETMDSTVVALRTDEGIVGWGEACPWSPTYCAEFAAGVRAGLGVLAPAVLGRDPVQVETMTYAMDKALRGHWYVKTAIDLACWDIAGKVAGRPACDLLGGRFDAPMPLNRPVLAGPPEDMAARVETLRSQGVRTFSCKLGSEPIDEEIERVNALLAGRRSGERYVADFNGGLTVADAVTFSQGVGSPHLLVEQPCRTYEECLKASRAMRHPVRLDEIVMTPEDVMRAAADDGCQGIVIKIGRLGGLTKARRVRDICVHAGLPVSVQDSGGNEIATAGVRNLARATPPEVLHSVVDLSLLADRRSVEGPPPSRDGLMLPDDAPGLGVTPLPDVLGEPIAVYGGKST